MYGQNPYGTPTYGGVNYQPSYPYQRHPQNSQMQFPNQMQQPQMQQTSVTQQNPIQEFRHGTKEEIEAHIVYPNCIVYFIDYQKNRLYSKKADASGMSYVEYYSLVPINADGTSIQSQEDKPQIDMSEYVRKDELESLGFVTTNQLNVILSNLTSQQIQNEGVKSSGTNSKSTKNNG